MEVAERYLAAFDSSAVQIGSHPTLGKRRRFRAAELAGMRWRTFVAPFAAHLVFYKVTGEEICLERVLHGARDLPRRLSEPPEDMTTAR